MIYIKYFIMEVIAKKYIPTDIYKIKGVRGLWISGLSENVRVTSDLFKCDGKICCNMDFEENGFYELPDQFIGISFMLLGKANQVDFEFEFDYS